LNVNGNVPAANYFRLPKIGKPPLGLRGRFAYVQARLVRATPFSVRSKFFSFVFLSFLLARIESSRVESNRRGVRTAVRLTDRRSPQDPERFYAIHLDILCVGSGDGPGNHDTGFRAGGAKTIRLSLSNLYKKKGDNKPYDALGGTAVNLTHEPAMRGWVILCFDVPQLLRAATTKAAKAAAKRVGGAGKKSAATPAPAFDAIKSIQIGGAIAARNIFTSDFLYIAEDLPTEMHLSSKPDVEHEFVWVGDVAPKGDYAPHGGAFYITLVPIRPRPRGERRSLRTFAVVSLRPPLAFNARPRRLSTPSDAFQLHPNIRSYGTTLKSLVAAAAARRPRTKTPRTPRSGRCGERACRSPAAWTT
jgi:hypothetical protein